MRATLRIAAALGGLVAVALAAPAWSARLATARVGQHADFTRIVFELDAQAGYRVERSVGPDGKPQVVVTLAATLGPNAPRTIRSGSSLIESVTLEQPQDRIVATIRLRGQALPVKEMILASPPRIVLDVLGTDTALAARERTPQARPAPAVAVAPKPAPAPEPEVEEAKPTPVAVAPSPEVKAEPVAPKPVPEPVAPTPEPKPAPAVEEAPKPVAEPPKPGPAPEPAPATAAPPEAGSEAESAAREAMDRRLAAVREAAEQRRRQLEQEKREKEMQAAQERLAQEKQRQREQAAAEQSAAPAPAPAAPADAAPSAYVVGAAGGLLIFALVLAVVLIRRRTLPRNLDVTAFDDSEPEPRFAAEEDTPEMSTRSRREPLTAPGEPRGAPLSAPGLFDESEKGESEMEPHAQDLPVERGEAFSRSARGADVSGAIAELERRMAALEARLQESNAARERLERQVAAQSEELRVQRAAIARTQRALRGLSRSEEEQATEPALRD